MVRTLLVRGMLAGVLAGLLTFAVGRVLGEPQVDRAIAFETANEAVAPPHAHGAEAPAAHHHDSPDAAVVVSRPVQAGAGLFTAVVVYGAAFGGLFALVFAAVYGRAIALPPRATAAVLAGAAFVAIYLVPSFKYPANPPAVGDAETIGLRTSLYFVMLAISVASAAGGFALRRALTRRLGSWNASVAALAAYAVAVAIAASVLPTIDEVPAGFPATLLWNFRVASAGMQLVLWSVLGLAFGVVADRVLTDGMRPDRELTGSTPRSRPVRLGT